MSDQEYGLSLPKFPKLPKIPGLPAIPMPRVGNIGAAVSSYFFRPGGVYSIAICRVALFAYLWFHVVTDAMQAYMPHGAEAYLAGVNLSAYYPKSIVWFMFPNGPPPAWFIDVVLLTAQVSTVLAIFGVFTRISMILSTLSCLFLASLIFSWEAHWSHPYNSGLIAALAFMFGRAGDVLSVDSIAMRVIRRPISINRDVYWWPVILGLFGVAMVYFGGFYAKWSTPDFTYNFSWVFSDNLRNSVALPWLIRGQTLPWNADLIVNNPLLWQVSAFGHMATQFLPILALFAMKKPLLRLIEGLIFVAGAFLLLFMMGMWNPEWIILAAFFVDWDWLMRKVRLVSGEPTATIATGSIMRGVVITSAFAFMALNLVIIFFRIDDRGWNRLYPFSSMTFYSNVAASKPYNKHLHYPFTYGEAIITTDSGSAKWSCSPNISSGYVVTFDAGQDVEAKATKQLGAIKAMTEQVGRASNAGVIHDCQGSFSVAPLKSVDLFSSILNIPAYPAKVRFDVGHHALVGRYEADTDRYITGAIGSLKTADGTLIVKTKTLGLTVAKQEILLANDPWKNEKIGPYLPVKGVWDGNTFTFDAQAYAALPPGWYPMVLRITEPSGKVYDFFGGVVYES